MRFGVVSSITLAAVAAALTATSAAASTTRTGMAPGGTPTATPTARPTSRPTAAPAAALTAARAAASPNSGTAPAAVGYALPVAAPPRVVGPFAPPATRYAPGHRGVDLAVVPGAAVRAAADGAVSFAGTIAGRGVVVLVHADGISTEYEPVRPAVATGARVSRGAVIGWVRGSHRTCQPDTCLHWGARRGEVYLDPMSLLRALGPVRLLPWQ